MKRRESTKRPSFLHFLGAAAIALGLAACSDATGPQELDGIDGVSDVPTARVPRGGPLTPGPSQSSTHNNAGPLALYPLDADRTVFGPFKQNLAQTFQPAADADLRYVSFPVACATDVLLRLQIRSGGPDGTLLWDRSYDVLHGVADGLFIPVQIYGGLSLTGGTTYAFVLSSDPRPKATEQTCSILPGPFGDSYAGGQAFMNNPGFVPYWVDLLVTDLSGVSAIVGDLPFETLVR